MRGRVGAASRVEAGGVQFSEKRWLFMTESWHYDILSDSEDGKRLNEILSQCFLIPLENCASYIELVGQENYRLVRRDNEIAGGLIKIPTGHWLGGKVSRDDGGVGGGNCPGISGNWGR